MKFQKIGTMKGMQDGAIWGKHLFRFDADGSCLVYDLDAVPGGDTPLEPVAQFMLDQADKIAPHSNAVMFGTEYFAPGDEYPLLYSNLYNNFGVERTDMYGVCCVYRLERTGDTFQTTLVQLIKIGFADSTELWYSSDAKDDVRPYGNFAIDRETGTYYAFIMRDHCNAMRYYSFALPKLSDGAMDETYQVKKVTLTEDDVLDSFDCEYHHYIQGACTHGGKIYSVEGFSSDIPDAIPALRIIDPAKKCQEQCVIFGDYIPGIEPELIDFRGETCYYSDGHGNFYTIEF